MLFGSTGNFRVMNCAALMVSRVAGPFWASSLMLKLILSLSLNSWLLIVFYGVFFVDRSGLLDTADPLWTPRGLVPPRFSEL